MAGPWDDYAAPSHDAPGPWADYSAPSVATPHEEPAAPPENKGGIGRNFVAGALEALSGIPGTLATIGMTPTPEAALAGPLGATLAPNATKEGVPAQQATDAAMARAFQTGSGITHKLNSGLGLIGLNPEDVTSETAPERIARTAGAGATAFLFPGAAPEGIAEGVATSVPRLAEQVTLAGGRGAPMRAANAPIAMGARNAITGTASGLGAGVASEAVPDDSPVIKSAVSVLGAIAGGAAAEAPGIARGLASGVKKFAEPMTEAGQRQIAADTIRARSANPGELQATLEAPTEQIIPGSQPTTFQQTGDMGLGALEREQATKNPAAFMQRRTDQNQARMNALSGIQEGGNPDAVGTFLRGQFRNFDDQTQQHIDALTAHAQTLAERLGGHGVPEEHGAAIRSALQDAENAAKARERALWKTVDPDNNIRIDASPTFNAAADIKSGMSRFAAPMEGAEAGIFDSLKGSKQLSLGELADLRSRVSTAARNELLASGNSPAYARLIRLRGAIQNNLADAATNQATREAEAVAAGQMPAADTIQSRIQGWVDDYYGKREQSGAAGGEGPVPSTGGRPTGAGVPDGAGLPPSGGSANAPGAEGVQSGTKPITFSDWFRDSAVRDETGKPTVVYHGTQRADRLVGAPENRGPKLFDEDASNRLAEATKATRERAAAFNNGPTKQVLAKAGSQDAYRLPEARVPEKFFHAGPTSASDIQGLRDKIGDAAALPILQDYAAASLRKAAENADGTIDPRKMEAWQRRFAGPMRAFPELAQRFENAAAATRSIGEAAAARREAIADRNASALGKVMNANTGEDVTKTVGSILAGKNSASGMQQLAQTVSKNPEAAQGLRQAVADHIANKLVSNTEAGTSGTNLIKADQFHTFLKNNRTALAKVLTPEEMNTLDRISADLKRANRSNTAVKLPGGSNTAQDTHGVRAHNPNDTVLDRMLSEAGAAAAGTAVAHAPGGFAGWMSAKVVNALRAAGLKNVDDLVTEALLNPELARDLLRKAPPKPDSGQSIALAARVRRIAMAAAATRLGSQDEQKYADGGVIGSGSEGTSLTPDQVFDRNKSWVRSGATNFNTKLSDSQEKAFRSWVADNHVSFNPDQETPDYDMRGFYSALQKGDPRAVSAINPNDQKTHYPDYWKTPYDVTFSNESQWANKFAPRWTDNDQLVTHDGTVVWDDKLGGTPALVIQTPRPDNFRRGGTVHEEIGEEVHPDPSDAQIEAGNYKKGHTKILGFDLSIETPKGAARRGTGKDGKEWENTHPSSHYGYLKRTEGADEEHVDAYLGPHHDSKRIFVVNQYDPETKKFDEHKLIFGARGPTEARQIYDHGFSDGSGPKRRWNVHEISPKNLRVWLSAGKRSRPFPKAGSL